jgi:hypothetical protein
MSERALKRARELVTRWRENTRYCLKESDVLADLQENLRSEKMLTRGRTIQECADRLEALLSEFDAWAEEAEQRGFERGLERGAVAAENCGAYWVGKHIRGLITSEQRIAELEQKATK